MEQYDERQASIAATWHYQSRAVFSRIEQLTEIFVLQTWCIGIAEAGA